MAVEIPVRTKFGKLPLNVEFTPNQYQALLLQRLKVYLSGDDVLLGSTVDSEPDRNIGAWWRTNNWWGWDETYAAYTPAKIGCLSADGKTGLSLTASPTEDRTQDLQNSDGTIALLDDAYTPRETTILTGTNPTIFANASSDFYLELEGNTTIAGIHLMPLGKSFKIAIVNNSTAYTVTWPSVGANKIAWAGGVAPTQPVALPGQITMAIYTIRELNVGLTTHYWGESELDFVISSTDINPTPAPPAPIAPSGGPFLIP